MPKNFVCTISLLISWIILSPFELVGGSSSFKSHIPVADFPYTYWKPLTNVHSSPSISDKQTSDDSLPQGSYGHYYGNPIATDDEEDPTTWNASPIKVPKDIVGDVNEKTTIKPSSNDIVSPYPSSFSPQYGRHPGATEPPPLYFPQKLGNDFQSLERVDHLHSSYSQYNPIQNPLERQPFANIPNPHLIIKQEVNSQKLRPKLEPFTNADSGHYNYHTPSVRPAKFLNIISIDRNAEPPPHIFYAVEDPSQVDMKILHKNGTHTSYVTPHEKRRRYFAEHQNKFWRNPFRNFFRPKQRLRYNRYHKRKKFVRPPYQPNYQRQKYNENIIDLMKHKVNNNKMRKSFDAGPQTSFSAAQPVYHQENEIISSPLKDNRNKYIEDYNHVSKPDAKVVSIVKATNLSDYITSDTVFISKPPSATNTNYIKPFDQQILPAQQHPQTNYDFDGYNKYSSSSFNWVPKPAPNVNPDYQSHWDLYRPNNHYSYLYHKNKHINYEEDDEGDYDAFAQSIMERMAGLQDIPASVVIPGGLAALGLGLAYYYFNYVWYPTPVVTARLSEFLRSLDHDDKLKIEESASTISQIIEVFRSIESAQFSSEFGKISCRNRIVCQIHQDIPNMLDATKVITPFLRTKPNSSELNKAIQAYLSTARRGSRSRKSCKDMYRSCKLPYFSLKPLLNLFFKSKKEKEKKQ